MIFSLVGIFSVLFVFFMLSLSLPVYEFEMLCLLASICMRDWPSQLSCLESECHGFESHPRQP